MRLAAKTTADSWGLLAVPGGAYLLNSSPVLVVCFHPPPGAELGEEKLIKEERVEQRTGRQRTGSSKEPRTQIANRLQTLV